MNGQCARVLDVLSDGESHSVKEIHERAGTMRLNSRVSELRRHLKKRDQTIICTRAGGRGPESYLYTLVPLRTDEPTERMGPDGCSSVRSETKPSLALHADPPEAPGHVTVPGPASSGASPQVSELAMVSGEIPERDHGRSLETASSDVDVDDLRLELRLIEYRLDIPVIVDSENARSTRAILERQRGELRERLAAVA